MKLKSHLNDDFSNVQHFFETATRNAQIRRFRTLRGCCALRVAVVARHVKALYSLIGRSYSRCGHVAGWQLQRNSRNMTATHFEATKRFF